MIYSDKIHTGFNLSPVFLHQSRAMNEQCKNTFHIPYEEKSAKQITAI